MITELKKNEKINEVNFGVLIIEKKGMLSFGTDALLLSAFVSTLAKGNAADFGTGSGIISLLCAKTGQFSHIDALERSEELASLTERNIAVNFAKDRISCMCIDVRDYKGRGLDCVFSNPPYMRAGSGIENDDPFNNDARRENHGTISDFAASASKALTTGGKFICVYRPERLCDLFTAMKENGIEPKILVPVCHSEGKAPSLILCEGVKGGKSDIKFCKQLILTDKNGNMTADVSYIYEKGVFPHDFIKD